MLSVIQEKIKEAGKEGCERVLVKWGSSEIQSCGKSDEFSVCCNKEAGEKLD